MKCTQPALSRELFESASLREFSDHSHLAECSACRQQHEQLSRMQAYWDREPLSQAELLRLEMRCRPRQVRKRQPRPVAWAAFGGVLALGTAAAAAAGVLDGGFFSSGRASQKSESPAMSAVPKAGRIAPTPGQTASPEERATEQEASAVAPNTGSPRALNDQPVRQAVPERPDSTAPRPNRTKPSELTKSAGDAGWIEAAEALKRDDHAAAEKALKQLSKSGDAMTRDAAQLTLAETYLERGQRQQAEPILRQLAAQGATATIRARAQKLLQ